MRADERAAERIGGIFDAAMEFGLSNEEVWEAVREICDRTPPDKASSSICLAWPQLSQIRKMQSCRQSGWSFAT